MSERTCDGHPAWECTEECEKKSVLPFDGDVKQTIEKSVPELSDSTTPQRPEK